MAHDFKKKSTLPSATKTGPDSSAAGVRTNKKAHSAHKGYDAQKNALQPKKSGGGKSQNAASGGKSKSGSTSDGKVKAKYDNTQISEITFGNQVLTVGEGFYVIGSETGEDRPDHNVRSPDSDGQNLYSPGDWKGAPFSLKITGNNPFFVNLTIGPMPTKYATLSVPLDLAKGLFDSFSFSGSGYEVGAGGTWQKKQGNSGKFKDIPQPAMIPGHGPVGVAKTAIKGPGFWAEVSGGLAKIRRTVLSGNAKEMHFYHHPYTHNIEINFGSVSKGSVVTHHEKLEVLAANEAPGKPTTPEPPGQGGGAPTPPGQGGVPSSAKQRLEPLYKGLLGRAPDDAGLSTFGPQTNQGVQGLKAVAAQILASPEFLALRGKLKDAALLGQMYQGFFGRKVDPSGAATFSPWLAQGKVGDVANSLIESAEFRAKYKL